MFLNFDFLEDSQNVLRPLQERCQRYEVKPVILSFLLRFQKLVLGNAAHQLVQLLEVVDILLDVLEYVEALVFSGEL